MADLIISHHKKRSFHLRDTIVRIGEKIVSVFTRNDFMGQMVSNRDNACTKKGSAVNNSS